MYSYVAIIKRLVIYCLLYSSIENCTNTRIFELVLGIHLVVYICIIKDSSTNMIKGIYFMGVHLMGICAIVIILSTREKIRCT